LVDESLARDGCQIASGRMFQERPRRLTG
jgi:hypothetical protein